jgi:hypothetical protein
MMLLLFLTLTAILSMAASRPMAVSRGRSVRAWMIAAALLGPLPLIPLAALRRR